MQSSDANNLSCSHGPLNSRISFDNVDSVKEIPNLDDLTNEEIRAVWYSREDFEEMKNSSFVAFEMMRSGVPLDEREHCIRGLEFRTRQGSLLRQRNRYRGCVYVLKEQERQAFRGVKDPDALSKAYRKAVSECERSAYIRGLRDALEINVSQPLCSNKEMGINCPICTLHRKSVPVTRRKGLGLRGQA